MKNNNSYTDLFYEEVANRADKTAKICSRILSEILSIETFLDVGSGTGIWTRNFLLDNKAIKHATAIDLPGTRRIYLEDAKLDLNTVKIIEQNLIQNQELPQEIFDLVICLEVLEHLTEKASLELISEFSKKCKFLLFSAAVPGQGGTHHINEQTYEYWYENLRLKGFVPLDVIRSSLDIPEIPSYYRNNIVLFVNYKFIEASENQINFKKMLKYLNPIPSDMRNWQTILRYKILSFLPHQIVTILSKIRAM